MSSGDDKLELHGSWSENDARRIFVEGAKWWQYIAHGATAFRSEVDLMETEAQRRYAQSATAAIPLHNINEALCDVLNRTPNNEELERLQKMLENAMIDSAIGAVDSRT